MDGKQIDAAQDQAAWLNEQAVQRELARAAAKAAEETREIRSLQRRAYEAGRAGLRLVGAALAHAADLFAFKGKELARIASDTEEVGKCAVCHFPFRRHLKSGYIFERVDGKYCSNLCRNEAVYGERRYGLGPNIDLSLATGPATDPDTLAAYAAVAEYRRTHQ